MATLTNAFNKPSSMFGGFVSQMENGTAQLARSSMDAGSKFFSKVAQHLSKEGVAVVLKGILLSAGAAAATVMMPAIAPLVPAIAGYMGQASVTALMMQAGHMAAEALSNAAASIIVSDKKPQHQFGMALA